ncbi:MAG TPA: DUF3828 domain-containing protein [Fimbriimonadaceae bacterium]|nr:DUF3828 domain-containing protein [Fimbriimonadaceae bacterium]
MKRLIPTLLIGAVAVQMLLAQSALLVPAAAQTPRSQDAKSCLKFVNDFYAGYLASGKNADPLRLALKEKGSNFSKELVQRLNEDYRAAAKSPDEIVGLDFDPVLNGQDFADKYVATKVTKKGNRYLVEVFAVYGGKRDSKPAVIPELQRSGSRWVFMNFHYPDHPKPDNLLNILKRLKADRDKGG